MPGHRKRRQFKQTDAFTRGMVIGLKRAVIVAVYACGVDVEKGPIRQQLWNAPPCDNVESWFGAQSRMIPGCPKDQPFWWLRYSLHHADKGQQPETRAKYSIPLWGRTVSGDISGKEKTWRLASGRVDDFARWCQESLTSERPTSRCKSRLDLISVEREVPQEDILGAKNTSDGELKASPTHCIPSVSET
ncbi:hypothetical protein LAZ67_X004835 [Cordylochernes scorpioides]|uniref:Uncharacterized protein n=1 Tax=Cordylochernes scorpioides TaxID=51811 RepID=A0ABY6LVC1_9ARAC|nr:hypothetical protein LAZ67_X004835 [Cordylochernes scorpioides]